jgi:hypothetical protein
MKQDGQRNPGPPGPPGVCDRVRATCGPHYKGRRRHLMTGAAARLGVLGVERVRRRPQFFRRPRTHRRADDEERGSQSARRARPVQKSALLYSEGLVKRAQHGQACHRRGASGAEAERTARPADRALPPHHRFFTLCCRGARLRGRPCTLKHFRRRRASWPGERGAREVGVSCLGGRIGDMQCRPHTRAARAPAARLRP